MPLTDESRKLIFNTLKKNLDIFSPPMIVASRPLHYDYEIIGNKPVPYGSSKKIIAGMFFAGIANCKDSVAFHFFPSYMSDLKSSAPSLYKFLKGKTCFHFKAPEQVNEKELNALLKKGVDTWKKAGYMK